MARPKNEATRNSIEAAAWSCFAEVGYAATTYDLIAQKSGKGRPLVQHYYPKKSILAQDMLTSLMNQCVALTEGLAPAIFSGDESAGAQFYIAAQVLFTYLFNDGLLMFSDILKSRELTAVLLRLETLWPSGHADAAEAEAGSSLNRGIAVAFGGFYELAYRTQAAGAPFDAMQALEDATATFLQEMGCSSARAKRVISESELSSERRAFLSRSISLG